MAARTVRPLPSWSGSCNIVGCLAVGMALCICGFAIYGCADREPAGGPETERPEATSPDTVTLLRPEAKSQADNSACLDCHLDFADELISATHLKEGFGCTACHGESVAHGEDEANVIKPDVLFGRSEIGPFCRLCHGTHKSSKEYDEFVSKWRGRRRPSGVILLDDATCTDCHGRHLLVGEG